MVFSRADRATGRGRRRRRFWAQNQIADLATQLAQLAEQVNRTSRHKGALLSEQTALQAGLQQAQSELRTQEVIRDAARRA
jgi:uncharacterized protein (DUF3084 family)